MSSENYTHEQLAEIRRAKSGIWAKKGAGLEYLFLSQNKHPLTRLKNLVEIIWVLRQARGKRILDAGAGTGRVTFPLQERGATVVAMDISGEMLDEGRKYGADSGRPFHPCIGAIDHLPFPDGHFDSVVSINVLRHFPHWQDVLREYLRVTRPGGRVVFDMKSRDHELFAQQIGFREKPADDSRPFDPLGFEASITRAGLQALAQNLGATLFAASPLEFINSNMALSGLFGDDFERVEDELKDLLRSQGAINFYEMASRRFIEALGPATTFSLGVVIEKCGPSEPPSETAHINPDSGSKEKDLEAILQAAMGRTYNSFMREAQRALEDAGARRLFDYFREKILPGYPLESLYWQAKDTEVLKDE